MRKRVAIIGAGNVGTTTAMYLARENICDIVVIDVIADMAKGKCLDLIQAGPIAGYNCKIEGTDDIAAVANADLVVITAGFPRRPGMSREDLIDKNAEIVGPISENIGKYAPNSMVLVVTIPLDIMTYLCWKVTEFPAHRVFGQGGMLDSIRFRALVAAELGISSSEVQAMVLGGHGESMLPLPSYTTVAGISITELISANRINEITNRIRNGGEEMTRLLKTGSAYFAPAAATAKMIDSVICNHKRLMPVSAYADGQFGLKGIYIGMPVILGEGGVEKIVEPKLSPDELAVMQKAGAAYQAMLNELGY